MNPYESNDVACVVFRPWFAILQSAMVRRTAGRGGPRRFAFTVPLVKLRHGSAYVLEFPEGVSSAMGARERAHTTDHRGVEVRVTLTGFALLFFRSLYDNELAA